MKYHVNMETGDVGRCRAQNTCPFEASGQPVAHYASAAEAQKASEAVLAGQFGQVPTTHSNGRSAHDLSTMAPVRFDKELSKVYKVHEKNRHRLDSAVESLHRAAGDRRGYRRGSRWTMSDEQAREAAVARADNENAMGHIRADARDALDRVDAARAGLDASAAEIARYDDAFAARGGWSRFFLVENTGGHIHSSMHCSTCRMDTQFSWLPSVSGSTEEEAVKENGPLLCSVCFPSAPTEWTNFWEKEEERKKAESCPGSGTTDWVKGTTRFGYAAGNGGTCSHCGGYAAATASGKIRKHKPGK